MSIIQSHPPVQEGRVHSMEGGVTRQEGDQTSEHFTPLQCIESTLWNVYSNVDSLNLLKQNTFCWRARGDQTFYLLTLRIISAHIVRLKGNKR